MTHEALKNVAHPATIYAVRVMAQRARELCLTCALSRLSTRIGLLCHDIRRRYEMGR